MVAGSVACVMASSEMMSASRRLFSPSPSAANVAFSVSYWGRRNLRGLGTLVMEL